MNVYGKAGTNKIQSYLVDGLTLIQSDLNSSFTSANTLQIVFSYLSWHDMLDIGNTFQRLLIKILWQSFHINIDDFLFGQVSLLVVFERIMTSEIWRKESLLLLLSFSYTFIFVVRRPAVICLIGCWCWGVAVTIKAWLKLTLLHALLIIVCVVLFDLTLGIRVYPIARSRADIWSDLFVGWTDWTVRLVVVVVHINRLLCHWCILWIISLFKYIRSKLILFHLISINLSNILWLRETSLSIPAGVGTHVFTRSIWVVPLLVSCIPSFFVSVGQNIWLKLLLSSIFSACDSEIVGSGWSNGRANLILSISVSLLWVTPVSSGCH